MACVALVSAVTLRVASPATVTQDTKLMISLKYALILTSVLKPEACVVVVAASTLLDLSVVNVDPAWSYLPIDCLVKM